MVERVLEGKVVMLTGAGRGLGLSMAIGLAEAGANLVLVDLEEDVLTAAEVRVAGAGGQGSAIAVVADVSDGEAAERARDAAFGRFGRIDVLINDAAIGPQVVGGNLFTDKRKFWELDDALWKRMFEVNVFGPQLMARTVVAGMNERGWGRIINVTTSLDTMFLTGTGAYGPSKAALEAHSRVMMQDLDGTGVTVNVLVPGGAADTRMIPETEGFERENLIAPEAMRAPAVWLASEASAATSGMRFIAALWDESLPLRERIEQAGAPVAWAQIPSKAIYPGAKRDG